MTGEMAVPDVRGWSTGGSEPSTALESHDLPDPESWEERFSAAIPLFIIGSACLVVAVELYFSGTATSFAGSSVRLRPWILFVALGVTGIGAGAVALFTKGSEWESPSRTDAESASSPTAEWDESEIEPVSRSSLGPLYGDEGEDPIGGSEPPPLRADLVLSQLDEIEESLRRRSRPSPRPGLPEN